MANLLVLHRVADYEAWLAVFEEHGAVRRQYGCTGHRVLRMVGDDLNVLVDSEWPSAEAALAFAADPSLKEAMERAGVVSEPRIELLELAQVREGADA